MRSRGPPAAARPAKSAILALGAMLGAASPPPPRRAPAAPSPRAAARRRQGSPSGAPAAAPTAGAISLLAAETTPRKSFYFGYRDPRLNYTIASSQPENDLRIDVLDATGEVVKTFYRENVAPNVTSDVRWDGTTNEDRPAPNGRYSFRVSRPAGGRRPPARQATLHRAQPRLLLLPLRLPDPRRPRIRHAAPAASAPAAPATPTRART